MITHLFINREFENQHFHWHRHKKNCRLLICSWF